MHDTEELVQKVKAQRARTDNLRRDGMYWDDAERAYLKKAFYAGISLSEIAIHLQRSEAAVFQEIEKLDLFHRKANPIRHRCLRKRDPCKCRTCKATVEECPQHLPKEQRRKENSHV